MYFRENATHKFYIEYWPKDEPNPCDDKCMMRTSIDYYATQVTYDEVKKHVEDTVKKLHQRGHFPKAKMFCEPVHGNRR